MRSLSSATSFHLLCPGWRDGQLSARDALCGPWAAAGGGADVLPEGSAPDSTRRALPRRHVVQRPACPFVSPVPVTLHGADACSSPYFLLEEASMVFKYKHRLKQNRNSTVFGNTCPLAPSVDANDLEASGAARRSPRSPAHPEPRLASGPARSPARPRRWRLPGAAVHVHWAGSHRALGSAVAPGLCPSAVSPSLRDSPPRTMGACHLSQNDQDIRA